MPISSLRLPRLMRMRAAAVVAVATASMAGALPTSAVAAPGDYTQILCANPDTGLGLGVDTLEGLSFPATVASWQASVSLANCGTGLMSASQAITLGPRTSSTVAYNDFAALHYKVTDPALSIRSGQLYRAWSVTPDPLSVSTRVVQHGGPDPADATAPTNGFDWFWTNEFDAAEGDATAPFASGNRVELKHDGRRFSVTAQCRATGSPSTCTHAAGHWSYKLFGGKVQLHDAVPPQVTQVGGSLTTDERVATERVSFRATDEGAGVYRVLVYLDGEVVHEEGVTSSTDPAGTDRRLTCFDVNNANYNEFEFVRQQPCPQSHEGDVLVDTREVADGPRRLRAVVQDAGGNETVLTDRDVTVDNHPAPALTAGTRPQISGKLVEGETVTGLEGAWDNAARRDAIWWSCETPDTCMEVLGAHGTTYVPTAADVGKRLRFSVLARNDVDELTMEHSALSAPIERAAGTPRPEDRPDGSGAPGAGGTNGAAGAAGTAGRDGVGMPGAPGALGQPNGSGATTHARLKVTAARGRASLHTTFTARPTLSGRLTTAAGSPIAGAAITVTARPSNAGAPARALPSIVTRADGTFRYRLPSGPSRTAEFAYSARHGDLVPAARAQIRLVVPAVVSLKVKAARAGKQTLFTGRLKHLPRPGVQLEVQARDGRRWRTFDTTRTRGGGGFRFAYRFKRPATGLRFAFRVVASSPTYPFARGVSPTRTIRVPG